jgi:translation initiation factor IF-3
MLGVIPIEEALNRARARGVDLVEISPNAEPPVCKIMDYGKYKYELTQKEKEARKRQHADEIKEIKFHVNVGDHDFETKVNHIRGFLEDNIKVKISLYFRGRENAHRELGFEVINRVLAAVADLGSPEMTPKLIGNSIFGVLGPKPQKVKIGGGATGERQNAGRPAANTVVSAPSQAVQSVPESGPPKST